MEQTLHGVLQDDGWAQRHPQPLDCLEDGVDHMGRGFEDVWPDVVEQVPQRILTAERKGPQRHVFDSGAGGLPVDQVAVHEGILQQGADSIDVVLAHLTNVLEQEGHGLEDPILDVELGHTVLVHEGGDDGEGGARFGHNGNGDGGAHAVLTLLHLQVVQQGGQHVGRANGLRNVAKGVHRSTSDSLLVGLQQLQQLETDAHPLTGRDKFRPSVGDAAHEIDAVLLHLLVPILQDGRQPWQQVLDRRGHLVHAHHIDNGLEGHQDGPQHLRILLPEVLVEHHPHVAHQLLLLAVLHHLRNLGDQIGRLLPHTGVLVVQPPLDGPPDLGKVRPHTRLHLVDDRRKARQHDLVVVRGLFLERVQNPVHELLLEPGVDVGEPLALDHLLNGLHDHAAVGLVLVLQVIDDLHNDLRGPHLVCNLHRGVDQLLVVAAVEGHPLDPEVLEERGNDLLLDVVPLHTLCGYALLHHLEHNLLHLLVRTLELTDQDVHHLTGVVVGVLGVHEGDDVPDGLEEGCEPLPTVLVDTSPQWLENAVEGLNAVRVGGLRKGGQGQGRDGPHLLLLVRQTSPRPGVDDLDKLLQVGKHGAAHQDSDLLDNLDPGVPGLPGLLRLTDGLQERDQGRDPEGGGHHSEGAGRRVAHVLVHVVDVRPHGGNHRRQPGCLGQVRDDLTALHAGIVVLIDQQGLNDDQDLVHVRPHHVVKFVQDAVNHLDQQVPFLVLQRGGHEQGQDLVKEGAGPKLTGLVRDLSQGLLTLLRVAVLHLQQELHDLRVPQLLGGHLVLVLWGQEGGEEVVVLRLQVRQVGPQGLGDVHPVIVRLVVGDLVTRRERRGGGGVLAGRSADRFVAGRRLQHLVAVLREQVV
mmetsp:Transcript_45842/g.81937  ORF Transcript_45842/g.81937 Transcript_45842/m.81937 type:complete len:859 (-) Transcript_45842:1570-4146(-)